MKQGDLYVDLWLGRWWNHCGIASASQSCFMTQIYVELIFLCAGKKLIIDIVKIQCGIASRGSSWVV